MDPGKKISGEFIIAGRDGAKVLEFVEEALNEITLAIEGKIAEQRRGAARVGRNHGGDLPVREGLNEAVGVVALSAMSAPGSACSSKGSPPARS